jgi:hypothetical protein
MKILDPNTFDESTLSTPAAEPASDRLHPLIYRVIVGLALWLLVSVWYFFDTSGYIELALGVITALVFMAIAIPLALSRTSARNTGRPPDAPVDHSENFAAWRRGNFDTWTGRCRASTAAIEVLLPIAAVAFGMTAFGIIFTIARSGAG